MPGAKPLGVLLLLAVVLAVCSGNDGGGDGTTSPSSSSSSPSASAPAGVTASSSTSSSSSSSTSTGPAPLSGNVARDITDNAFPDGTFTIAKGTTVTWTNRGSNPHTVTEDGGAFDSGIIPSVAPANTYARQFDSAGTFPYHCDVHPSMTGTITVV